MSQLPPSPPSPSTIARRRRRRKAVLSFWQFVTLSTGVAIAILASGLWVLNRISPREQADQTTSTTTTTAQPTGEAFELPHNADSLTTKLLPSIALDETPSTPPPKISVQQIWQYRYNDTRLPQEQPNPKLAGIIAGIKELAVDADLPLEEMSVVLIDLNTEAIATYQGKKPHYPASVAKLFWMVALYGQFQQGLLNEADFQGQLQMMVQRSDNNATSQIIDAITRTTFQAKGSQTDYDAWRLQREQLNFFFTQAGYDNINITQKTYPIPDIQVEEPMGFDLQMRYDPTNPDQPIRNRFSAWDAARLMYEIVTQQAIAPEASQKMLQLLHHDLSQDWQTPIDYFNPVQNFFGSGLSPDTQLYGKAGWTTQCRHEVAYITSLDGQKKYILSVFADHPSYAENETFFPDVAQYVHKQM